LLINDRVDVALAIGATGVHLGQSDMPVSLARKLLPAGTILGVSCNTVEHVRKAVQDGADYVGIGSIYPTQTKNLTEPTVGVRGIGPLLEVLEGTKVKAVAIGGIKATNLPRLLHGAVSINGRALDGVAVVSDVVASDEPRGAAAKLAEITKRFKEVGVAISAQANYTAEEIIEKAAGLVKTVRALNPLVHQVRVIIWTAVVIAKKG
jgi:thiamine-phosphate diphosphorylase/hydroxyethylthiazole kinase